MKKYFLFLCFLIVSINLYPAKLFFNLFYSDEITFRDSVDVINYQINLKIGDYSNQKIEGNTILTLKPVCKSVKSIKLDLLGLEIDSVKCENFEIEEFYYKNNIISIKFKETINQNDTLKIKIVYNGKPKKDNYWGGFYFTKSSSFNMGVGMYSDPPSFGRTWFPCIDNFKDRATYEYNITVNEGKKAICSGILTDIKTNDDNTTTFCWKLNQTIPTYLSSVSVGDYTIINETITGIENEIPFQYCVFKGNEEKARKSLVNFEKVLQIFEDKFGLYAWSRIGFVETGFSSGAMEHATNISLPYYAFNGTLNYELLIVHEFAHSWFGNLVTCETAVDMWLNEGWASYCEAIFIENFYGEEEFKNYVREKHLEVLKYAHVADGNYYGISDFSSDKTYGTTVYDKGASVIHTLRNYIGDEIFFGAVKKYLDEFKFSAANTFQFRDSISEYTNTNLTDFFDFYVKEEGFNHFSINNFSVMKKGEKFFVEIEVKQRLIEADFFSKSNKIGITFIDKDLNFTEKLITFSGEYGDSIYILDFKPEIAVLDLNEKIMDATTDCYQIISKSGNYDFESTSFSANALEINDSVFIRVQNNWIDPEFSDIENYIFSDEQYWTIDCILNSSKIVGNFNFSDSRFFYKYPLKEKILLYRKNNSEKWIEIETDLGYNYLKINELKTGEYIFAVK